MKTALQNISDLLGVSLDIDILNIEDEYPVTIQADGITVAEVLDILVGEHGFRYSIQNGKLRVTTD